MEAMLDRIDPVFELCGARVEFVNAATDSIPRVPIRPTDVRIGDFVRHGFARLQRVCWAPIARNPPAGFEVAWVAGADRVPLVSCSEVSLLLSLFSFCRSAVAPLAPPRRVTR